LIGGELFFMYSCGNAPPASLLVSPDQVSDGRWHSVLLEVNSSALRLTLDRQHPASSALPDPCRMMRSHGALLFAQDPVPQVRGRPQSFVGCLENLELNGERIGAGEAEEWTGSGRRRVFGVYRCCSRTAACDNNPCQNGGVCEEDAAGEPRCRCSGLFHGARCGGCPTTPVPPSPAPTPGCHNQVEVCSPNPCPGGFNCKVTDGSIHCDPLPQVNPMIGYMEIMEISASVLGLLFLVGVFICIRKRYVQHKKKKPVCVQDSNGYFQPSLAKSRSAPAARSDRLEAGFPTPKTQGPVVCSVAPNLPARPPSCSDNDSIRKNHWDMDYEVYPADPDYYGRPSVQEFPQFDIVEDTYSSSTMDSRRNSRFGGFPFPLDRCDRRAPLPPCYSNQNLDDFLGPDGLPLPSPQCPNEYTAISYYPTQHARSLDNVSTGYKRLSMRLSVAMPSYAEQAGPPPPNPAQPQTRPAGQNPRSFDGSSMVESDYGSCEEVMF
ncbi:protocadherin Fat 2, partial [Lates calcarifer]|uniref:Protocadherin Fat 2 n=1 Tax=Lates calcarifer TaxID=8187 RepID=A0AAJ7Q2A9_LATCA